MELEEDLQYFCEEQDDSDNKFKEYFDDDEEE